MFLFMLNPHIHQGRGGHLLLGDVLGHVIRQVIVHAGQMKESGHKQNVEGRHHR